VGVGWAVRGKWGFGVCEGLWGFAGVVAFGWFGGLGVWGFGRTGLVMGLGYDVWIDG